jgi:hypothetical protein
MSVQSRPRLRPVRHCALTASSSASSPRPTVSRELADELERSPVGRRTQSHPKRDRTHVRTELALLRAQRSPAFDACFRYGWLHPLPCSPGGGQHRQGDVRPALLRQTFSESPRQPAGDALCSWPPDWSSHREMAGQWTSDPDLSRQAPRRSRASRSWRRRAERAVGPCLCERCRGTEKSPMCGRRHHRRNKRPQTGWKTTEPSADEHIGVAPRSSVQFRP